VKTPLRIILLFALCAASAWGGAGCGLLGGQTGQESKSSGNGYDDNDNDNDNATPDAGTPARCDEDAGVEPASDAQSDATDTDCTP
jgi:hypothetical protein